MSWSSGLLSQQGSQDRSTRSFDPFLLARGQQDGYSARFTFSDTVGEHTVYTIEVVAPDGRWWQIKKRYSEVRKLDEQLRPFFGDALPPMPGKRLFGNLMPAFVQRRMAELQLYLDGVLRVDREAQHIGLRCFLDLGMPSKQAEGGRAQQPRGRSHNAAHNRGDFAAEWQERRGGASRYGRSDMSEPPAGYEDTTRTPLRCSSRPRNGTAPTLALESIPQAPQASPRTLGTLAPAADSLPTTFLYQSSLLSESIIRPEEDAPTPSEAARKEKEEEVDQSEKGSAVDTLETSGVVVEAAPTCDKEPKQQEDSADTLARAVSLAAPSKAPIKVRNSYPSAMPAGWPEAAELDLDASARCAAQDAKTATAEPQSGATAGSHEKSSEDASAGLDKQQKAQAAMSAMELKLEGGRQPLPPTGGSWDWPLARPEAVLRVLLVDEKMSALEQEEYKKRLQSEDKAKQPSA